jgi:dTDP-4-amino-4,6-dideoxygalactose transaminase
MRGAKIVFADCEEALPNIDAASIEALVTPRTRVIVVVHYAGMACDMETVLEVASRYGLIVVEDAAQAIESFYKGKPLGSLGSLGTFSFHETKNIISGEGGMLTINDDRFIDRAEIIREKGTNRSAFFRGEIDKYGWVDIGSSFLPSDIIAAFLFAQLENLEAIQQQRCRLWDLYNSSLEPLRASNLIQLPVIPPYATNNAHMFYIVCRSSVERSELMEYLSANDILAVFHYSSLHRSSYYRDLHDGRELPNSDRFSDCLLRLPLYYELTDQIVKRITQHIELFFRDT